MNDPDAGIALGKCIAKDTRLVRRPVIEEDYIKFFICLLFNCFQTAREILLYVENRNNDTNQGILTSVFLLAWSITHSFNSFRQI